jgi:hypothetical protein
MPHREEIEALTYGLNEGLTTYLEVHNGVFAHPWWRSIPIPGLFKAIPLDRYEIQIAGVEHWLREAEGRVRTIYDDTTPEEQRYLSVLHRYMIALLKTTVSIREIVARLKAKTENKPYTASSYYADIAAYKEAEKGYHAIGEEMNRSWRAYRRSIN